MKIDRHNYEEYFVLYVDNELPVDQRRQVEQFVKENPDLEEELVMLQQSRLIPEAMVFDQKHLLMKEENNSFINLNNYEEWLVLYVDDELTEEQKIEVDKFAAAHAYVKAELEIFKQTKLPADEIRFPYKADLYKNRQTARIISVTWWRVAVAAVLIIAAGLTLYSVLTNRKNTPPSIVKIKEVPKENAAKGLPAQTAVQEQTSAIAKHDETIDVPHAPSQLQARKKNQTTNDRQSVEEQLAKVDKQSPHQKPDIVSDLTAVQAQDLQFTNGNVPVKGNKQFINDAVAESPVTKSNPETPDYYADNTENKKLRGLFRKATRFIERTSGINPANDDNRVLIGGMAINLK